MKIVKVRIIGRGKTVAITATNGTTYFFDAEELDFLADIAEHSN